MTSNANRIPEKVSSIHLIAICGTGMAGLACLLQDMGYRITGSDTGVYPPISDLLQRRGISVMPGFDPAHLFHRPDLVVVGNAVSRNNPEVTGLMEAGIPYCSMPQAVQHFAAAGKNAIVIAGTHGKTTTSALTAWILYRAGLDPGFLIGGILRDFGANHRYGRGKFIILEGDEYDTAFFDKKSKFLHYTPFRTVLTGIEFDHADIFSEIGQIRQAFEGLLTRIPKTGELFAFDSPQPALEAVLSTTPHPVRRYGENPGSEWFASSITPEPPGTAFDIFHGKTRYGRFTSRMPGRHNVWNAVAATAVAESIGIPAEITAEAIASFQGVHRRQEVRGCVNGVTVMDDFAHHPTAVRETIEAVRPCFSSGRLIAVFEPGTHTSMRKIFQDVYPSAFQGADMVCIRTPSRIAKVPAEERMSPEKLVADMNRLGLNAALFPDTESIVEFLRKEARPRDVILVMSNSGFDGIHQRLLEKLASTA
jgi:UDP-N-acetylmuramate: L-alanyl-gamma-D-glutamyl-meso-diaminopimelate ligase